MAKFIVETTVEVYSPEDSQFRAETTIETQSTKDWKSSVKMTIFGEKCCQKMKVPKNSKKIFCPKCSRKNAFIKRPYGSAQKTTVQNAA